MRRYVGEIVTAVSIIIFSTFILWRSIPLPAGGGWFPSFAAVSTIFLSLYWIVEAFLKRQQPDRSELVDLRLDFETLKPMIVLAITIAYVINIFILGFFFTTSLFLLTVSILLGVRDWRMIGLTLIILMPLIYLFFIYFLGVRLPEGLLI